MPKHRIPTTLTGLFLGLGLMVPLAAPAVEMIAIPGGEFVMGSPDKELRRGKDETRHRVKIAPFLLAKHEVTQAEYRELMGENPSHFQGDELPVENLTWFEAAAFCNASRKSNATSGSATSSPLSASAFSSCTLWWRC